MSGNPNRFIPNLPYFSLLYCSRNFERVICLTAVQLEPHFMSLDVLRKGVLKYL